MDGKEQIGTSYRSGFGWVGEVYKIVEGRRVTVWFSPCATTRSGALALVDQYFSKGNGKRVA